MAGHQRIQISGRRARLNGNARLGIGKLIPTRSAGLRIGKCTSAEHSTICTVPGLPSCMNFISGVVTVEEYDNTMEWSRLLRVLEDHE